MTTLVVLLLTSAFLTLGAMSATRGQVRASLTAEDHRAQESVDLLWCPDRVQRRTAKRQLLKLGAPAIPPLLSLLQDICNSPRKPRFPKGREWDARQALDHYQDYEPEDLYHLEITGRLRDEAAEVLGHLRAVEAVPTLIEVLRTQVESSFPRGLDTVMRSVAEIGPPAVPVIMEELENAQRNARSLVLKDEGAAIDSAENPRPNKEDNLWEGREVVIIRIRAIFMLGEIGGERALSALEKLLDPTREPPLMGIESQYVKDAIHRIKEKSRP